MRFERRFDTPLTLRIFVPLLSLFGALLLSGGLLALLGLNPLEAFREMWDAAFVDSYGLSESLTKAIPLSLCATGLMICYRMLVWNIGAQGQMILGALAALATARYLPLSSPWLMLPLMALAGVLAGGLWASIAGGLKAKWGVNIIITTLMLNYIALNLKDYLVYGPWRDPKSLGFPMTPQLPDAAQLPLLGFGRVHLGLVFAVILALFFSWSLARSRWGYEIRVVGENPRAARFAGINEIKLTLGALFYSGALCGFAGMATMAGLEHRLQSGFSASLGFTAIIVAWLANLNPLLGLFVSFLMGGLLVGGESLQVVMNLPVAATQIMQGLILLFLVAGQFLINYRPVKKGASE